MPLVPGVPVSRNIHEIPRRERDLVEIAYKRSRLRTHELALGDEGEPCDASQPLRAEVVFVNRDDIRRETIEIAPVLLEPVRQHGVRELDVVPVEAKPRRGVERSERRVGL